jgi:hypothetical protein
VRRNPPYGGGMLHSADYAAPKEQSIPKGHRFARLIRPTALISHCRISWGYSDFLAAHWVCSRENALSLFTTNSEKSLSLLMESASPFISTIS